MRYHILALTIFNTVNVLRPGCNSAVWNVAKEVGYIVWFGMNELSQFVLAEEKTDKKVEKESGDKFFFEQIPLEWPSF